MSPDWWRDCRDGIEKCSSPTGDGNFVLATSLIDTNIALRNAVPRQGTEIEFLNMVKHDLEIEKCSSPTGDGNGPFPCGIPPPSTIEKCSSPTGDGNKIEFIPISFKLIEKCSSPTGDGNENAIENRDRHEIEKCSSPTGDGNLKLSVLTGCSFYN